MFFVLDFCCFARHLLSTNVQFFSGLAMTTCYWKAIWCRICLKNGFTQSLNVAATS